MGQVWEDFAALPEHEQQQVTDFVAFLRQRSQKRRAPSRGQKTAKKVELTEEPFVGIWKDRPEMQDSNGWLRDLRQQEWTR